METDDATVDWDPSLQALLEPSYQMQIYIRKNLFTAVVPLDPGSAEGLFTIATLADNLKQQMKEAVNAARKLRDSSLDDEKAEES